MRFRGPKGELPKGSDGAYGTSLPMWKCMAEGSDVIIAWKQNGRLLDPDHGFPVSYATQHSLVINPCLLQTPFHADTWLDCAQCALLLAQVRMIIPGHIGGRMVKWLEEIEVADSESDNHYHFMDNRVLPSHVDEALAKEEGEAVWAPASSPRICRNPMRLWQKVCEIRDKACPLPQAGGSSLTSSSTS